MTSSMKDSKDLARILRVMSASSRIRIVRLLKERALCVGVLSARLGITQGAVSQHLRILRHADLVAADKRGYYVHYRLNKKTLARWKVAIDELLDWGSCKAPLNKETVKQCAKRRNVVKNRTS